MRVSSWTRNQKYRMSEDSSIPQEGYDIEPDLRSFNIRSSEESEEEYESRRSRSFFALAIIFLSIMVGGTSLVLSTDLIHTECDVSPNFWISILSYCLTVQVYVLLYIAFYTMSLIRERCYQGSPVITEIIMIGLSIYILTINIGESDKADDCTLQLRSYFLASFVIIYSFILLILGIH